MSREWRDPLLTWQRRELIYQIAPGDTFILGKLPFLSHKNEDFSHGLKVNIPELKSLVPSVASTRQVDQRERTERLRGRSFGSWSLPLYEEAIASDEDENYVYLADGDLDTIMGEGEVQEAHASYREVRQSLKEQRLGRGYFPWKGKSKFDPFGKGRGKSKVHIEQLKLRTRCRRCQQIGHWERECRNPPASDRGQTNVSSSASTSSSKGFFVQLAQPSDASTEGSSNFWLRQFLAHQKASREAVADSRAPSGAYKERILSSDQQSFCGISTKPFEGVVDTAAEGGLIGLEPLWRLQNVAECFGRAWT